MYDCIIVGCGFAGSVIARKCADSGKKVLLIDKRAHIGGNMYEDYSNNGVRVHRYGPHLLHTNSRQVVDFLKEYGEFFEYQHKVLGKIDGQDVPIPFNFTSLEKLFSVEKATEIKGKLTSKYPNRQKVSIFDLINDEDEVIAEFGKYVFDKVFAHYTAKQWGIPIDQVDISVINRVPVVLGYDDRYFQDVYQLMPTEGFTRLFDNMLNHKNITVQLNTTANDLLTLQDDGVYLEGNKVVVPIVYSGAIDEFCSYKYGVLPYRSVELVFEDLPQETYQGAAVVNYPNDEMFTRITEFKHFTRQQSEATTILKEYPCKYDINGKVGNIPYYVINNDDNQAMYDKYADYLGKYDNVYLCGRLAEYKYYNMDGCIERAFEVFRNIKFAK